MKQAQANFDEGVALLGKKEYPEALEALNKAISLDPNFAHAYYNKGLVLSKLNQPEDALKALNKALEQAPKDADAFYNKGLILAKLNKRGEAVDAFNQTIDINSDYIDAYYQKAQTLYKLNKPTEAIAACDQAIKLKPTEAAPYRKKANILYKLDKPQEAIAAYDKAISLKKDDIESYYNKGLVLDSLNKYKEALDVYEDIIKLRPDDSSAYYNQAFALSRLSRYEEALQAYDKTIQLKKDQPLAHYNRGNVLYDLKRYEEAVTAFNKAASISPDFLLTPIKKGACHSFLNDDAQSLADFKTAQNLIDQGNWGDITDEDVKSFVENRLSALIEMQGLVNEIEPVLTKAKRDKDVQKATQKFRQSDEARKAIIDKQVRVISNLEIPVCNNNAELEAIVRELKDVCTTLKIQIPKAPSRTDIHKHSAPTTKNTIDNHKDAHHTYDKNEAIEAHHMFEAPEVAANIRKFAQQGKDLAIYYKVFYWTLSSYLIDYWRASGQNASADAADHKAAKQDLSKNMQKYVDKSAQTTELVKQLDYIIDMVFEIISGHRYPNKMVAASKVCTTKFKSEQDLKTTLASAAEGVTNLMKNTILSYKLDEKSQVSRITEEIIGEIDELKHHLIEATVLSSEKEYTIGAKLALADVTLLTVYMYKNLAEVCKQSTTLDKQLINVISSNILEEELKGKINNHPDQPLQDQHSPSTAATHHSPHDKSDHARNKTAQQTHDDTLQPEEWPGTDKKKKKASGGCFGFLSKSPAKKKNADAESPAKKNELTQTEEPSEAGKKKKKGSGGCFLFGHKSSAKKMAAEADGIAGENDESHIEKPAKADKKKKVKADDKKKH